MKEEIFFVRNSGSENLMKVLIFHSYFDVYIINSTSWTYRVSDPKLLGGFFGEILYMSLEIILNDNFIR